MKLTHKNKQYDVTIEEITVDVARNYLATMVKQRRLKQRVLDRYMMSLKKNHWDDLTGETIIFDANGAMIDGQHRCEAVVRTGIPLTVFVIRGCRKDSYFTLDMGTPRTVSDVLHMQGEQNPLVLTSVLLLLNQWRCGRLDVGAATVHCVMSWDARIAVQLLKKHGSIREAVVKYSTLYKRQERFLVPCSLVTFCGYVLSRIDNDVCQPFMEELVGLSTVPGSPLAVLRNRLKMLKGSKERRHQLSSEVLRAWVIKAWNFYVTGCRIKNIRSLIWFSGTAFPEFVNSQGEEITYEDIPWE